MPALTAIDLSRLPPPAIVEAVDYEEVLAQMLADLRTRDPIFSSLVESDPAYKILEVAAYRETILRQRINDALKAVLLATSTGTISYDGETPRYSPGDLDHLGALLGVERKILVQGDPVASPPTQHEYEPDADFRRRIQLSLEGFSTAGPAAAYLFHALSHPAIKDAAAFGPNDGIEGIEPGEVHVFLLGHAGDGALEPAIVDEVEAILQDEEVRPLTDTPIVAAAEIEEFTVEAIIYTYAGPDPAIVLAAAQAAVEQYVAERHKIGATVTLSGLYAALHQPGAARVEIESPEEDVATGHDTAPYCTGITLLHGGIES